MKTKMIKAIIQHLLNCNESLIIQRPVINEFQILKIQRNQGVLRCIGSFHSDNRYTPFVSKCGIPKEELFELLSSSFDEEDCQIFFL